MRANSRITSDADPNVFIEYTDIWVTMPERQDDASQRSYSTRSLPYNPHECRIRDLTYSAPIYVSYKCSRPDPQDSSRSRIIEDKQGVRIGKLPIMLRSARCHLSGKSEAEMARMHECPLDPGGYFVVRGTEKVILVQEQLSKNRCVATRLGIGLTSAGSLSRRRAEARTRARRRA